MLDDLLLAPLESLLNRRIDVSTPAKDACRDLDGRVLALEFSGTAFALYVRVQDERVRLFGQYQEDPDALLRGSPLALAGLARGTVAAASGGARVEIVGDAAVAARFQELLAHARPDWEEELSRLTGDVMARRLGVFARDIGAWGKRAASSLRRDTSEYLQEESRDVPARAEFEGLAADIDVLDADIGEAVERMERLEAACVRRRDRDGNPQQ